MSNPTTKTLEPSVARAAAGYAAMGKPVPYERRGEALRHLREMDPALPTEEAMGFIERLSHALGRDQPYDCLATVTRGTSPVDLCGVYRLMAVLLTPAPSEAA